MLARFEAQGFPAGMEVFHGKVSLWVGPKEVDVDVIEAFAGNAEAKHLLGAPGPGDLCGGEFAPGEEFIYLTTANVVSLCSKLAVAPETLARLRAIGHRRRQ